MDTLHDVYRSIRHLKREIFSPHYILTATINVNHLFPVHDMIFDWLNNQDELISKIKASEIVFIDSYHGTAGFV